METTTQETLLDSMPDTDRGAAASILEGELR